MTKRVTKIFSLVAAMTLLGVFVFSGAVQAQSQPLGNLGLEYQANIGLGTTPLLDIVANIINALFGLLGTVAVGLILYGGFLYMTSAGEREKVDKAKKLLVNAAIGLAIILSAYSIAAFIISQLIKATIGGPRGFGAGGAGYEAGTGALGGGIIQSHFPKRNAVDVPRNTSIAITFKEEVKLDQIIAGGALTGNLVPATGGGVFEIYSESASNDSDYTDGTKRVVSSATVVTPDQGKTFVIKPSSLFGNTTEPTLYTVGIKCDLLKKNLTSAFGTYCNADGYGYKWSFQVSTKLDLQPPTVTSVIPRIENDPTKANARNIIVQMNFSEPINPAAASGTAPVFTNIAGSVIHQITAPANASDVVADGAALDGRYEISNGYQTVEFTTNVVCGVNSCGNEVYCMPSNSNLAFIIKSPILTGSADQPFAANGLDGIIDMASNGLDGDGDGAVATPAGVFDANHRDTSPAGDSFQWSFYTNDRVDLIPPTVTSYGPLAGQEAVDPSTSILANFDKLMSSSSVKPDSNYGDGYCSCQTDSDCNANETCSGIKKYCIDNTKRERVACYTYLPTTCKLQPTVAGKEKIEDVCVQQEHVTVDQSSITPPTMTTWYSPGTANNLNDETPELSYSTVNTSHGQFMEERNYGLNYGSGLKDLFQNCYIPNAAPGCVRVPVAGKPGEYTSGNWPVSPSGNNYPSCDLSSSKLSTIGNYNLSYQNSKGRNLIQNFAAFSWDKHVANLYDPSTGLGADFDFFKDAFKPNTATVTMYYDQTATETKGYYYLIAFVQKPNPFVTALSKSLVPSATEVFLQSITALPSSGTLLINNVDEISYTGKVEAENKLTGVTLIDSAHNPGEPVEWKESGSFNFEITQLPAGAVLIYPSSGPIGSSSYSASLAWGENTTEALVLQIEKGTEPMNFKILPSTTRRDMALQVMYAGGSVTLPNDQILQVIEVAP